MVVRVLCGRCNGIGEVGQNATADRRICPECFGSGNAAPQQWGISHNAKDEEITRLRASNAELLAALKWCGAHTYAQGKRFDQVPPVKEAIANAEKM